MADLLRSTLMGRNRGLLLECDGSRVRHMRSLKKLNAADGTS